MLGLTAEDAKKRLREYGPNALPERPAEPFSRKLLRQFQSPLVYILLLALLVDLLLWLYEGARGVPLESLVILAILLLNALLGAFQEKRSEEALKRLKALAEPSVWVLRDGRFQRLSARGLVPGDVVRLEAGDDHLRSGLRQAIAQRAAKDARAANHDGDLLIQPEETV